MRFAVLVAIGRTASAREKCDNLYACVKGFANAVKIIMHSTTRGHNEKEATK